MKKYIWTMIALALLLCACQANKTPSDTSTDGSEPSASVTDSQPTQPSETDPTASSVLTTEPEETKTTEPAVTQPTETKPQETEPEETEFVQSPELVPYDDLFGTYNTWYNVAIYCQFESPTQIRLYDLFYNGLKGESHDPTDQEETLLQNEPSIELTLDLIRLPVDKMNEVLTEYFGITLADMDDSCFSGLVYLEETGCYYMAHGDFHGFPDFRALSAEELSDGTIAVTYTGGYDNKTYGMILRPNGDGYQILMNMEMN